MSDNLATVDSRTNSLDLDKMSDKALVNYAAKLLVKFAGEMRPVFIEVHTRFVHRTKVQRKDFLGYTDWDKFCLEFWNYTGRHIRRVMAGDELTKRKQLPHQVQSAPSKTKLNESVVWTDHDYIHKAVQSIKQILLPLESDPARYNKVAAAIVDEITGEGIGMQTVGEALQRERRKEEDEPEVPVERDDGREIGILHADGHISSSTRRAVAKLNKELTARQH